MFMRDTSVDVSLGGPSYLDKWTSLCTSCICELHS